MANKRKWIHLEKTNPVISYTLAGPDLDIFLELILKVLLIIRSVLVVLVRHGNGARKIKRKIDYDNTEFQGMSDLNTVWILFSYVPPIP